MYEPDSFNLARLLNLSGYLAQEYGDFDRAYAYYEQAELISRQHDSKLLRAAILGNMAGALRYTGRLLEAKELFIVALSECEADDAHKIRDSIMSSYGALLAELEPGPGARAVLESCMATVNEGENTWWVANLKYCLGISFFGEGDLIAAREQLESALHLFLSTGGLKGLYLSLRALATISYQLELYNMSAFMAGASEALEERTRVGEYLRGRFRFEHVLSGLKEALGPSQFKREFQQGFLASPEELSSRILGDAPTEHNHPT